MTHDIGLILWALLAFQVKHFICDFMLQTQRQVQNKGIYGHLAGVSHAAFHAVTSLPALFILTANPGVIGVIVVAEFLVHYHCDWLKSNIDRTFKLGMERNVYWMVFGLDQLIHQLTYLAIVFVIVREGWLRV